MPWIKRDLKDLRSKYMVWTNYEKTFLRQPAFLEELHMELLMGEIISLGFHLKYFKREKK